MGVRTVFHRSALGARVRSSLGSFQGHAETFLEISTWPPFVEDGLTYQITGEAFGATQGAGTVRICNRIDCSILAQSQSIVSWSDTEIVFTADLDSGALEDMLLYIVVTNDDGQSDTAASTSETITDTLDIESFSIGAGSGDITTSANICSLANGTYCGAVIGASLFDIFNALDNTYTYGMFFRDSPGFYIVGLTSDKSVEFGPPEHWTAGAEDDLGWGSWCVSDGGLPAFVRQHHISVAGGINENERACFIITYASGSCGVGTYGWTSGETVRIVPKYPVSISCEQTYTGQSLKPGLMLPVSAFAFAAEGDISENCEWTDGTTLLYTGETYTFDTDGPTLFTAMVTNAAGQTRYASPWVEFLVYAIDITTVFPAGGDDSGGAKVWIFGKSFESDADVEFDGVPATSVVFVNTYWLECVAPAGSGTVDVEVIDSNGSATAVGSFTYDAISNITVSSVSPTAGDLAGGETVTVYGTGFTTDCTVYFSPPIWSGVFEEFPDIQLLYEAASVTFISSTELEVETPDFSEDPEDPYVASVVVYDTVTGAGYVLPDSFTITA